MKTFLLILLMCVAAGCAHAAEAPAPAALEFKNKSTFAPENTRNPFWPIGWKPAARTTEATATEHSGPEIASSAFLVTSITLGRTNRFAIVNGKVMQEGQQFGLQMGSQTYQITVKAIQDGRVVFARRDQEIVAPLRRK